ncbi:PTS glucose transporter subunit IIA [Aerococcaceae bacterium DSM 111021]|nr:PTS glucose transporter subunit IIA [Aerococcaceae bacterium DSM 111021]
MDYNETASEVIKGIGGKDNINYLEHCSTRLRFTLNDDDKADIKFLESIPGVAGVRQNVQTQIIIGNDVNEVYAEIRKIVGSVGNKSQSGNNKKNQKIGAIFMDFLIGIFQPLVPAIAGGGVLKSILLLLSMFGLIDATGTTYQLLNFIGDAPLYFLPLLVAMTTARKLDVNQIVAVATAGSLILPGITTLMADGATLFTLDVQNVAYTYQVFPAILLVLFYALMEKFFTKYSPKAIRIFFVPMMSMVITVPVTLLFLGPLGFQVGEIISSLIMFLYSNFGWVATGLLAAILPFMVSTGMHKAMLPYAVSSMTSLGREVLYLPASLAHNIAESGACFAVAIRTKDSKLRSTAISAGVSALFGITEPALYGVTLQNPRVLSSVVIGSLVGGLFIGVMAVEAFALVGPGLASITMYADVDNSMNIVWAIVTFAISFVVAFVAVLFLYKEELEITVEEEMTTTNSVEIDEVTLTSPVEGNVMALADVNDDVFSSGLMGDGIAIKPTEGILYAPSKGIVKMIFNTNHAVGMITDSGVELLFHIGIDTVQLKGDHFKSLVKEGEEVIAGQALIEFDLRAIEAAGYDTTVIVVIQNAPNYSLRTINKNAKVNSNDVVVLLEKGASLI